MGGKLKSVIFVMSIILGVGVGTGEVIANKLVNRKLLTTVKTHVQGQGQRQVHGQGDIGVVNSMKTVNDLCATTTYKEACIKSLSSFTKEYGNSKPQEYLKSGVNLALDEITKASNLPNTLLTKANTKRSTSALKTCKELLQQSIDRLKMASKQVQGGNLKDPLAVFNLRLELSDVNTFSTNCLDEFGEAKDPQLKQLMQDGISNAKELSVNMLDVVSTYQF